MVTQLCEFGMGLVTTGILSLMSLANADPDLHKARNSTSYHSLYDTVSQTKESTQDIPHNTVFHAA